MFKNKENIELLSNENDELKFLPVELKAKIDDHKLLCDFLHSLYVSKNRDYGDSMHPLYEEYGLTAFMIMFSIKISRIKSLMAKGSAKFESLEDSLIDLANYAIIAAVELRAEKTKEVDVPKTANTDDIAKN